MKLTKYNKNTTMSYIRNLFLSLSALAMAIPSDAAQPDTLSLDVSGTASCMSISYDAQESVYNITTTGNDPYVLATPLDADLDADNMVLTFEYKSSTGTSGRSQVFLGHPITEPRSMFFPALQPSQEWTACTVDLTDLRTSLAWGSSGDVLRLDFGTSSGKDIAIRHIVMRQRT